MSIGHIPDSKLLICLPAAETVTSHQLNRNGDRIQFLRHSNTLSHLVLIIVTPLLTWVLGAFLNEVGKRVMLRIYPPPHTQGVM